jgi:HK97 family phage portal protein
VRVNDDSALRLAVLYACVNVIAQDLSKVPLMMFRRTKNGGRERVTDHPVIQLLRNPRTQHDRRGLARAAAGAPAAARERLLRDHHRRRRRVRELRSMKANQVTVEVMRDRSLRYHERDDKTGQERVFVEGEVLHFRGLSLEGPMGLSPIDQERQAIGESIAAQEYGASFFANDARPGVVLSRPGPLQGRVDEEGVARQLQAALRRLEALQRDAPRVRHEAREPAGAEPRGPAVPRAAQAEGDEICAIFRVPPHKVAILDRSTNNNIEHQGIEYVTDCLMTWCRRWEDRLAADLLTEAEQEEYYFEFILDALMRGDTKSRYEAYQSSIIAGWMTRNEVRRRENLDPLDDLDEPLEPVNMVPAGTQPSDTTGTPAPADEGAPDDRRRAAGGPRAQALELQARRRVLNRETRALSKEWERSAGDAMPSATRCPRSTPFTFRSSPRRS